MLTTTRLTTGRDIALHGRNALLQRKMLRMDQQGNGPQSSLKHWCCFSVLFELHSRVGVYRQLHQKRNKKTWLKNTKKKKSLFFSSEEEAWIMIIIDIIQAKHSRAKQCLNTFNPLNDLRYEIDIILLSFYRWSK